MLHLLQEDPGGRVIDPAVLSGKFAALFRRLIEVRLSHGDFKATNFILEDGEICLIDLDSMKSHRVNALFKKAFRRDLRRFQKNWESLPEISQTMDKAAREGGSLLNSGRIHEKNDELKIQNEKV